MNAQLPLITDNTWRAVIGGRQYWSTAQAFVNYYTGDELWDFVGKVSGARFLLQATGVTYMRAEGPWPGVMVMTIKGVENTVPATHYEGTFSGTVKDDSGNITEIKDGVFRVG